MNNIIKFDTTRRVKKTQDIDTLMRSVETIRNLKRDNVKLQATICILEAQLRRLQNEIK